MAKRYQRTFNKITNYGWTGIIDAENAVASGTKVLLGGVTTVGLDETLLRTVGLISVRSDQLIAIEEQIGAFGMIVVSDTAFALGATAVPGPVSDKDDDSWAIWEPFANSFAFISAAGFDPHNATVRNFDYKSKRIINAEQTLALVVEASAASEGFTFSVAIRVLSMVRGT